MLTRREFLGSAALVPLPRPKHRTAAANRDQSPPFTGTSRTDSISAIDFWLDIHTAANGISRTSKSFLCTSTKSLKAT